jgi:hypothetical protein
LGREIEDLERRRITLADEPDGAGQGAGCSLSERRNCNHAAFLPKSWALLPGSWARPIFHKARHPV